jgi:predicted nucleic acid-binding protein
MRQRIYIDTSVVGGFFDEEFKDATQRLFGRLEKDEVRFIISDLLELELIQAPRAHNSMFLQWCRDELV